MSKVPTNSMRTRLFGVVFIALVVVAAYICVNLFGVSVINADYYKAKANDQQLSSFTINANRGVIYDTNGKILAHSLTVWDVIINPAVIQSNRESYQTARAEKAKSDYQKAVEKGKPAIAPTGKEIYDEQEEICVALSEILEMDIEKVRSLCEDTSLQYQIVKKKVAKPQIDELNQFKKDKLIGSYCVYTNENSMRTYPNDSLASNIIGFTNFDNEGIYGIEAYYDEYLQGIDGKIEIATDVRGQAMPYDRKANYPAQNGNSIYLTIDEVLQHYLEKNLETTVSQHKVVNRATAIMMDPNTGAIKAMATSPNYDLNNPSELNSVFVEQLADMREQKVIDALVASGFPFGTEADLKQSQVDAIDAEIDEMKGIMRETQWKNKAVSELYFPGSVFKVVTCASALEEQVVGLGSSFYCQGYELVGDREIHCHYDSGHGSMNLTEAITKSCNPAFMQIGRALGVQKFSDYFEAFGFTQKTGIDLPGESRSLYMKRENMGEVELASSAFGQTNKVTPIQMITAYAAVINGGRLVTPYVVEKIVDNNGNVIKTTETTVKRQVISEETSAYMRQILENVVESNGGANAYIPGYRIGGKSGTTEKLDEKIVYRTDSKTDFVSTFCAFTPADDPKLVMLVCVDTPTGALYYGSAVAAPVVSAVFKECLTYLEIYPQYTAEELAAQEIVVPSLKGVDPVTATTKLNAQSLNASFVGDQNKGRVLYTVPQAGQRIAHNGTVVVYLEEQDYLMSVVPDVTGMTVASANQAITNAGLNISLSGASTNDMAIATLQSISGGTSVASGTVIEVMFVVNDTITG